MGTDPHARSAPDGLILDPLAQAVSAARHYVRQMLPTLNGEDCRDNAELAVSELVTNATLHARTAMRVDVLRTSEGRIRIAVRDGSAMIPQPRAYGVTATTGRGLRLVDAVCLDWGVDGVPAADGVGKTVWCEPAPDASVVTSGAWDDVITEMA